MKIEGITLRELPELKSPYLVAAFAGWPDAAQVATGTVNHIIRKIKAKKFGSYSSDDYYSFTSVRPEVNVNDGVISSFRFLQNNFYYYRNDEIAHDLIFFKGTEPDLHWPKFVNSLIALSEEAAVTRAYLLGGFFDRLPHTRRPVVSGAVSEPRLLKVLEDNEIGLIDYQGPTSIHGPLLAAYRQAGIDAIGLWGHVPFYVKTDSNPAVCLGLLERMITLLNLPLDLSEVRSAARALSQTLDQILQENGELGSFVKSLEEQFDSEDPPELPENTDSIIREVEELLRRDRGSDEA